MIFNSNKNLSHMGKEGEDKTFKKVRVDNVTEFEVVLDIVLSRGTLIVKVMKVYD